MVSWDDSYFMYSRVFCLASRCDSKDKKATEKREDNWQNKTSPHINTHFNGIYIIHTHTSSSILVLCSMAPSCLGWFLHWMLILPHNVNLKMFCLSCCVDCLVVYFDWHLRLLGWKKKNNKNQRNKTETPQSPQSTNNNPNRTEQQDRNSGKWVGESSVHATWFRSMVERNKRKFIFLRCAFGVMNDSIQIASKITDDLIEYKLLAVMNIFFVLSCFAISSLVKLRVLFLCFVKRFSFQLKVHWMCLCVAFIKQISRSESLSFSFSFPFVCCRIQLGCWTNGNAERQTPKFSVWNEQQCQRHRCQWIGRSCWM